MIPPDRDTREEIDWAQFLTDVAELRAAYGFLTMRLAVASNAQDAYDICKCEWAEHEAAFTRTEPLLVNVHLLIERSKREPRETP